MHLTLQHSGEAHNLLSLQSLERAQHDRSTYLQDNEQVELM